MIVARDQTAIVGVGSTEYYRRGQSWPQSTLELGCKEILAALDDAGIPIDELDGFSYYCGGLDSSLIANTA